jgi:hypothetical protein
VQPPPEDTPVRPPPGDTPVQPPPGDCPVQPPPGDCPVQPPPGDTPVQPQTLESRRLWRVQKGRVGGRQTVEDRWSEADSEAKHAAISSVKEHRDHWPHRDH